MGIDELSDRFDVLLNSYSNTSLFGADVSHTNISCDEYEKSVFLTEAQDELYTSYYNGRNTLNESFEDTEELRSYLYPLQESISFANTSTDKLGKFYKSHFVLPKNLQFITLESVDYKTYDCVVREDVEVIPVEQDEWHRIKKNPFRGPKKNRVIRMDEGSEGNREVTLFSVYPVKTYLVRYLRILNPIILVNLSGTGLHIKGKFEKSTKIDLPVYLHDTLLRNAVQKAITSKSLGRATTNNKE